MPSQKITITLDESWRFIETWRDDLGRRMVRFRDGHDDEIIFEVMNSSAADEFMKAAKAIQ